MAAWTRGKYILKRRTSLSDYKLFQADFNRNNNDIDREGSGETFTDETGVNFVDETFGDISNTENTDNVVISTPNRVKRKDYPIPNGCMDDINWR